ncbi:MAG: hypothetical protein RPR28_00210, partial [Cycloclasticus sp.]
MIKNGPRATMVQPTSDLYKLGIYLEFIRDNKKQYLATSLCSTESGDLMSTPSQPCSPIWFPSVKQDNLNCCACSFESLLIHSLRKSLDT